MTPFAHIYLSWRKGPGASRHIVGRLKRNATEGVRFDYLADGVAKAKKDGFSSYTEFPDLTKSYNGSALDIFGQRIMKSERADINDFLKFWEISPKYKSDKYYLLARTQGLNPADNFEFLADYNPIKGLCFFTDLAGLSTFKLSPTSLKVGDKLSYKLEKTNEFDDKAVKVFFKGQLVGYIKKIHSRVFHRVKEGELQLRVKALEINGIIKRVFVKVELL